VLVVVVVTQAVPRATAPLVQRVAPTSGSYWQPLRDRIRYEYLGLGSY